MIFGDFIRIISLPIFQSPGKEEEEEDDLYGGFNEGAPLTYTTTMVSSYLKAKTTAPLIDDVLCISLSIVILFSK